MARQNPPGGTTSTLLLEEHLRNQDAAAFATELKGVHGKGLKSFGSTWFHDATPFARAMLVRYVDEGCDQPHHRVLVKKLFKNAEGGNDDELMAHFMVAFDRLLARKVVQKTKWDRRARQKVTTFALVGAKGVPASVHAANHLGRFTRRTRQYLERRAFRYFREIGRKDPLRYGRAIRAALVLYEDKHLERAENVLDAWGLVHALYAHSPALVRRPTHVQVAPGHTLSELAPAPMFPGAWRGCLDEVLELALRARSRTVRAFCVAWLKAEYKTELGRLAFPRVRELLKSPHDELQMLGVAALENVEGLESLSVAEWLDLLSIENVAALEAICALVAAHVVPGRLSLAQCVALASAKPAPVAALGLEWVKQKPLRHGLADLETVLPLRDAPNDRVRAEAAKWLVELVCEMPEATPVHLRDLFDSRHADVRDAALAAFARTPRFANEPGLWAALAESPYDDARGFLAAHLDARARDFTPDTLRHFWATCLLAVHRGSRAKPVVLRQVAERMAKKPEEAAALLPLLRTALRSVRAPERRGALAALARAMVASPSLKSQVEAAIPELRVAGGVAA